MFPVLLEELKKAEHFIFMEYFIVEHGVMWDAILQVLETKAAEGVEVRFMYRRHGNLFTAAARRESDAGEGSSARFCAGASGSLELSE